MKYLLTAFLLLAFSMPSNAQIEFELELEAVNINELGGLQSFAYGQANGKWLIVGGRLDGLHRRQPFAAFDVAGHNNQLIVVDPINEQKWSASLTNLSQVLQEQLSSTNIQFHQVGDMLYLVGGYGFSDIIGDHATFPNLAVIDVAQTIDAIVNGEDFSSFINQTENEQFAVTGGRLEVLDGTFYLVGGHRFDGRYNPMNHPTFTQTYTNAIRKFTVDLSNSTIAVSEIEEIYDEENLHRRDYNLVPQIMPDGSQALTLFSGVFQIDADIPFLNSVDINGSGYEVNNNFSQYFNHYHCAYLPMFSETENEMHNVFFGGIAQYYEENGELIQDDEVPFVKTVANVIRDGNGNMTEYKLSTEMPDFLGAGSEFIINPEIVTYGNGVINMDALENNSLVGYIFGGINSTAKNILFSDNDGSLSSASSTIYKVHLTKTETNDTTELAIINPQSNGALRMQVSPNPSNGHINLEFYVNYNSHLTFAIYDVSGKKVSEKWINKNTIKVGKNEIDFFVGNSIDFGTYLLKLDTDRDSISQKLIINY